MDSPESPGRIDCWSKGFTNTHWVEVLKEELLLVIIQKLEMAMAEPTIDVLYHRKVAK